MRRIDRLVLGAIVPPFLISATVLTFVVFVREMGRLSELFITRSASLSVIGVIAGTILPGILIFSLPLSFLIGSLIGLTGLSGESQITALRACGIPLRRLLGPLAGMAAAVAVVTGALSIYILPRTTDVLENLKYRISLRQITSQIQPRIFNDDFPDVVFYLDDLAPDRQRWSRVFVADNSDPKAPKIILAREGSWVTDDLGSRLQLHLLDGKIYQVDLEDEARDNVSTFMSTDIPIVVKRGTDQNGSRTERAGPRKPVEMPSAQLWRGKAGTSVEARREELIEFHRRLALPCSVFAFALLALPLGVSTRKTGRTAGFVIGLVLVILFYVLFWNGLRLASVGWVAPWLGAWGADALLMGIGLFLVSKAERGTRLAQRLHDWRWRLSRAPETRPAVTTTGAGRLCINWSFLSTGGGRLARRCVPKILDFYIGRGFILYFAYSVLACSALFVVLTLFELLDDIIRNQIPAIIVADYFFSLFPQILLLVVPMAVLLATLIHFGILEKSSEITAIKAGGWSLYRISIPVVMLAACVCAGLYLLQDYILPFANIRQDSLRSLIKGRPAQTMKPQRKWILGEGGRAFNYDYFDASQDRFVDLDVFLIDLRSLEMRERIHAARAEIRPSGTWVLQDGWIREYSPDNGVFRRIAKAEFKFPEQASYFKREIFEPRESSKLTYLELKNYITYLSKAGYNATELRVELYKKISFPLSGLVMALLGIPFSFSMGKRGAFFGIGASVVIAIVYWGVLSVFEQMGAYGLLAPALAAWAPDVLFGAAGLSLLLAIRT
jgi:LPS export ABC transporter permease LptG/LPS export ABC transporter permease LptF